MTFDRHRECSNPPNSGSELSPAEVMIQERNTPNPPFGEVSPRHPHIIVFANEKGGVGKSTTAFHTCISLCNDGHNVAAFDLDFRQKSLARAIENREKTSGRLKIDFPSPKYLAWSEMSEHGLANEIRVASRSCNYIIIDVAGHDSDVARYAISVANTLITPINDSFVDLELLGHLDPIEMRFNVLGPFSRLVNQLSIRGRDGRMRRLDWVVLQNRLRRLGTHNETKFSRVLREIAPVAGFRLASGLGERVIYRELFPYGLTVLDMAFIPEMRRAQPVAMRELLAMIDTLDLNKVTTN